MKTSFAADKSASLGVTTSATDYGVVTMVMDRPDQRNAMSAPPVDRMIELLGRLGASAEKGRRAKVIETGREVRAGRADDARPPMTDRRDCAKR